MDKTIFVIWIKQIKEKTSSYVTRIKKIVKNLFDLYEQSKEEKYKKSMVTRYIGVNRYSKL